MTKRVGLFLTRLLIVSVVGHLKYSVLWRANVCLQISNRCSEISLIYCEMFAYQEQ